MNKASEALLAEVHTDVKWIKKSLDKKAGKWTEKVLGVMMLGSMSWTIGQLLKLIPTVQAFIKQL